MLREKTHSKLHLSPLSNQLARESLLQKLLFTPNTLTVYHSVLNLLKEKKDILRGRGVYSYWFMSIPGCILILIITIIPPRIYIALPPTVADGVIHRWCINL